MSTAEFIALQTERCVACGVEIGRESLSGGHVRVDVIPSGRMGPVPVAVLARFCSRECYTPMQSDDWGCFRNWKPEDGIKLVVGGDEG